MSRSVAPVLLALVCAASHAGCTFKHSSQNGIGATAGGFGPGARDPGGAEPSVDELVRALGDFTQELTGKVESAADTKAGVAEAQKLLDARTGEMLTRIAALKKSPGMRDAAARGRWLEAEVDNTQRVRQLRLKYLDAAMRDPELKARLDRLVADYDAMFADR